MIGARELVLSVAGSLSVSGCHAMPPSLHHPLSGARAPAMLSLLAEPSAIGLPDRVPTKATVIDFWAPWCEGCQTSLPALDALYRDKHGHGLRMVGVSVDAPSEDTDAMAQALHASFPMVEDPDARFAASFRVSQLPLTFVLDREGRVRFVGRDVGAIRRAVEVVLSE